VVAGQPTWRIYGQTEGTLPFDDRGLPHGPLLARGLRPYSTFASAVNDWVFGAGDSEHAHDLMYRLCLVALLPDLRARVTSAEWMPGNLKLEIDAQLPWDNLQLQIIQYGSASGYQISGLRDGHPEIEIPDDARKLAIFIVDQSGERLCDVSLNSVYECYGKAKVERLGQQQASDDLAGGETDRVEFKPFIEQKDQKELEFTETVIAFANTSGGRVYVGASDDGSAQGEVEACRVLKANVEEGLADCIARLKSLVREKVKPVPDITVRRITVGQAPIVVVEVQRGNNPPYSTHENRILVRRGASNRVPNASELRELVCGGSSLLVNGL